MSAAVNNEDLNYGPTIISGNINTGLSNDDYKLDFDFDNFEEELAREIEAVKTIDDFENVIDKFLEGLDFSIDLDEEEDLDIDEIIKE